MNIQKSRWSKVYESSEEELIELLDAMNIEAERWAIEPNETRDTQSHNQDMQLWCAEGSCTLNTKDETMSVQPGDSLFIPSGLVYEVAAGIAGCAFYEAAAYRKNFAD